MKVIWMIVLAVGLALAVRAQDEPSLAQQKYEADRAKVELLRARALSNTFEFVSGQLISGPAVKGAPYSGDAVNETVQTLADGNRIVQRTSAKQYRDADGRERREETSAMGVIFITDPVAGARYTLHPDSQSAEKGPMPVFSTTSVSGFVPGVPAGRGGPETFAVAFGGPGPGVSGGAPHDFVYVNTGSMAKFTNPADAKTEQLGNMSIEGLQAEGTRTTITIPAGEIGNDRPISIVDERWYSPDLKMTVMTKHSDPRMGETNFALKNINRSSAPSYLFEIPPDYTVKTGAMVPPLRVEKRE